MTAHRVLRPTIRFTSSGAGAARSSVEDKDETDDVGDDLGKYVLAERLGCGEAGGVSMSLVM
jgi:hypothetical protein